MTKTIELLNYMRSKSDPDYQKPVAQREPTEVEIEEKFKWVSGPNDIFDKSPFYNTGDGIPEKMRDDIRWAEAMKSKMKVA